MHLIYGGTFDPVHHGHLRLAIELKERLNIEQVVLVPCHVPPHRAQPGADSHNRLALLRLAIEGEPGLTVDDRELGRDGVSYTVDTLRQLRAELGADEPIAMVVGTDAFAAFDRWHDWQVIPELAHIIVVNRPGAELTSDGLPAELLLARQADSPEQLHARPGGLTLTVDLPLLAISATGIREAIQAGRSPRYLLPDRVWAEIQALGLYLGS
ncbi:nicotinate-nucleotide adenylyltransferase [Marinobacter caseinilyticus]|uniref:nicotinate-nucleotide adenylyltransferase n=1 Tax=Marinobacter caseinilyticus TaxID=2692195 RepID=UPI00140B4057|nr:nicotinate-nucleotide adenylyltransferase [Marinobacter caseinilyticus]